MSPSGQSGGFWFPIPSSESLQLPSPWAAAGDSAVPSGSQIYVRSV